MVHQAGPQRPITATGPIIAGGIILAAAILALTFRAAVKTTDEELLVRRFEPAATPNLRDP